MLFSSQQPRIVKKTTVLGKSATTTLKVQINKQHNGNSKRPKASRRVPNPTSEQLYDYVTVNRAEVQRSRPPAGILLRQKQRENGNIHSAPHRNIQVASFHQGNSRPNSAHSDRHVIHNAWNSRRSPTDKHEAIKISFRNDKYRRPQKYIDHNDTYNRPKTSRNIQQPPAEQFYNYVGINNTIKPSDLSSANNEAPRKRGGKYARILSVRPEDDKNKPLVYDVKIPRRKQQSLRYENNSFGQKLGDKLSTMEIKRNRLFYDNRPNTLVGESTSKLSKSFDRKYRSKNHASKDYFDIKKGHTNEKMVVEVNGRRGVVHFEKMKPQTSNNCSTCHKNSRTSESKSNELFTCRSKDIMVTTSSTRGVSAAKDNVLKSGWFKSNKNSYQSDSDSYDSDDSQERWRPAWNSSTKLATGLKKRLHGETKRSLKIVNDNNRAASKAALRRKAMNGASKGTRGREKHKHKFHHHEHRHNRKQYASDDDDVGPTQKIYSKNNSSGEESDYNYSSDDDRKYNKKHDKRKQNKKKNRRRRKHLSEDDDDEFWSSSSSDEDSYARYKAKKKNKSKAGMDKIFHSSSVGNYVDNLIYRSDRVWPSQTIQQLGTSGAGW